MSLEDELRDDATWESSGTFTLDSAEAVRKFATHALPTPHAWILKLVQTAVAAEATHIQIEQTPAGLSVEFDSPQTWSAEQFALALTVIQTESNPAWQHLKPALWHLAWKAELATTLQLPGSPDVLLWGPGGLRRLARDHEPTSMLRLRLNHHTADASQMLAELQQHAYACPIPLTAFGRRIDTLQNCPGHGLSSTSCPLAFRPLALPGHAPVHWPWFPPTGKLHPRAALLFDKLPDLSPLSEPAPAACVLSMHLQFSGSLQPLRQSSACFWVQHGVVVARDLLGFAGSTVSCALFAPAAEFKTDASGLHLVDTPERQLRARELARQAAPICAQIPPMASLWAPLADDPDLNQPPPLVTLSTAASTMLDVLMLLPPFTPYGIIRLNRPRKPTTNTVDLTQLAAHPSMSALSTDLAQLGHSLAQQ